MTGSLRKHVRVRLDRWARRRHGTQSSPLELHRNRIYILPTKAGAVFALMLFIMLLGAMNYNNSMGLTLSFILGSFMFIAMHHCHRNLLGLKINYSDPDSVFAGQLAYVTTTLTNSHAHRRLDLSLALQDQTLDAINLEREETRAIDLNFRTLSRGRYQLERLRISCRYPGGLFEAWTWVYWDSSCLVYPKPDGRGQPMAPAGGNEGGQAIRVQGEEDFAELREYQHGDNLGRIAWKALARSDTLLTKTFESHSVEDIWFDWEDTHGEDVEQRLSQLTRWVVDADINQQPFGLRLPNQLFSPAAGNRHTQECLTALALFT